MTLFRDQFMIDSLRTEITVMKQLKSDYVVRMYDVFGDSKQTVNHLNHNSHLDHCHRIV